MSDLSLVRYEGFASLPEAGILRQRLQAEQPEHFQHGIHLLATQSADGSLVVVDTGGWYKLCCPSSQLQKPDVLGGVYRVRRKGTVKVDDPRGLKLPWMMPLQWSSPGSGNWDGGKGWM